MKQLHLITLLSFMFLIACTSRKKEDAITPMQFSERIVNMELELQQPLANAETLLRNQADSTNYQAMGETAGDAEKLIQGKIDEIKKMSAADFKGGEDFKEAAINYFEYIRSIYTNYKNIGQAKSEGARLAEVRRMDTIKANQENVITLMQAAQDKFAIENGFKIDSSAE